MLKATGFRGSLPGWLSPTPSPPLVINYVPTCNVNSPPLFLQLPEEEIGGCGMVIRLFSLSNYFIY